ncbi:MAG: nucleoside kinase [Oscillospiraceae bacterium]|nr:nucleoside kinase [Oscillospiraceae bacterium]
MRIIKIESINRRLKSAAEFINFCEEEYTAQITLVAQKAAAHADISPIVLLSGPSGSGKTISSLRLKDMLARFSHPAKVISMDNYFLSHNDPRNEVDEDGNLDLESPSRMDRDLIGQHIQALLECKEIHIPHFDFKTQQSLAGETWRRRPGESVIFEGIHALNPTVTGAASNESVGVYVSVRTRIETAEGELLHPSKVRLARRFVRDRLFRGRSLDETFNFFSNVELGEEKYIMPYKERAKFDIDTFIPYELCAYKSVLSKDLDSLLKTDDYSPQMKTLSTVLTQVGNVEHALIPDNSLVREFIGN